MIQEKKEPTKLKIENWEAVDVYTGNQGNLSSTTEIPTTTQGHCCSKLERLAAAKNPLDSLMRHPSVLRFLKAQSSQFVPELEWTPRLPPLEAGLYEATGKGQVIQRTKPLN